MKIAGRWIKAHKLNGAQSWDLMKKLQISLDQLDMLRFELERKHENFEGFIASSKTTGTLRRAEQEVLQGKLGMTEVDHGIDVESQEAIVGVRANLQEVLHWVLDLAISHNPGEELPDTLFIKVSSDGRTVNKKNEVVFGFTPMNIGLNLQSCYSFLPVAVIRCKENYEAYKKYFQPCFSELQNLVRDCTPGSCSWYLPLTALSTIR